MEPNDMDNVHIECNDIGADFYKARFDCPMSEILKNRDRNVKEIVYPKGIPWNVVAPDRKLVMVQFNQFDCGGVALSTCVSHKVGDMCSMFKFIRDWAAIARDSNFNIRPQFIESSFFPPKNEPVNEPPREQSVTKRLAFSNRTLKSFISECSSSGSVKPTHVEMLTTLVYKCAMRANSSRLFRPSILFQTINLRPFIPLPEDAAGNFSSSLSLPTYVEEEMKLSRLVSELRKGKEQLSDTYRKCKGNPQDLVCTTMRSFQKIRDLFKDTDFDLYRCSSLASYPFYSVDFGWGEPDKVISMVDYTLRNIFSLYDNKTGDHIEAQVSLDEERTMSAFLREMEHLIEFQLVDEDSASCLLFNSK
ncbi:unnamed protein product [Withania somnifera]